MSKGASTPFEHDAAARAERSILFAFLVFRASQLLLGLHDVITQRGAKRIRAAALLFVAGLAESAWVANRSWARLSYEDSFTAWTDVLAWGGGMLAHRMIAPEAESHGWPASVAITAAAGAGVALPTPVHRALAGGTLAATHVALYASLPRHRRRSRIDLALGLSYYVAHSLVAGSAADHFRRTGRQIDETRKIAIETAQRLSREREQTRLHVEVHRRVLSSLEAVAASWNQDRDHARSQARREAVRLRAALRTGTEADSNGMAIRALDDVAEALAAVGLRVELVSESPASIPFALREPIARAVQTVLESAARRGATRSIVRVTEEPPDVVVTLRDYADTELSRSDREAVKAIVAHYGGRAEVRSGGDRHGTRVALRFPT